MMNKLPFLVILGVFRVVFVLPDPAEISGVSVMLSRRFAEHGKARRAIRLGDGLIWQRDETMQAYQEFPSVLLPLASARR